MDALDKAIEKLPDITSASMMEDFGNEKLDDINKNATDAKN